MPGNGICRDPGFKNFLVRRGHSPPRAPPLGIPEPTAESLRKAVENTEFPSIPTHFNLNNRPLCQTLSKAFDMSKISFVCFYVRQVRHMYYDRY